MKQLAKFVAGMYVLAVMGLLVLAACTQGPEVQKSAKAVPPSEVPPAQKTVIPAPIAPAPGPQAPSGAEVSTVSGTVTKIDKGMGLLELQTPSGWSQFILTDLERKKELERITVGDGVDVKVAVRGSDRKVVSIVKRSPSGTIRAER
ncbi:MAG: hypothetical protein HZA21_02675 [Nitrospirae bacterium]|nr:hypothetical protein [Nitrospirota bacterium]